MGLEECRYRKHHAASNSSGGISIFQSNCIVNAVLITGYPNYVKSVENVNLYTQLVGRT